MIEAQGLAKRFADGWLRRRWVHAVRAMSWQAPDACITGLLGPNGAGKTTSLRLVAGLMRPDAGQARVGGVDVQAQPLAARRLLGVLSDGRGLYPRLSARENIVYHGRLHGLSARDAAQRADELGDLLELGPLLDRPTGGFSQGERMKTALARALVHRPGHLILDEPTNGLDVPATRSLRRVLRRLRDEQGCCIVFSSHVMQEVERLCDRVVVVAGGRTVAAGRLDELVAAAPGAHDMESAYLHWAHGPGATPGEGA